MALMYKARWIWNGTVMMNRWKMKRRMMKRRRMRMRRMIGMRRRIRMRMMARNLGQLARESWSIHPLTI
jgi:hypothetical protein